MLDPTQALEESKAEGIELASDPFWSAAFNGAVARLPVLVNNLTRVNLPYYLVDFRKQERSTGRMIVDANTGLIGQVTGVDNDGDKLPLFIAPEEVTSRIPPVIILDDGRQLPVPPGPPVQQAVWKHSLASRTMFLPLYRLMWGAVTIYMRIDGRFYDELKPTTPTQP